MYLNAKHQRERALFLQRPEDEQKRILALHIKRGLYHWHLQARDKQLAINRTGRTLLNAARGFGKTKALLEFLIYSIVYNGAKTVVIVGETATKVSDLLIEGADGLIALLRRYNIKYEKNHSKIKLPKYGAMILGYSGDTPDRLRGFNADLVILDELCAMYYAEETLLQSELICRKGDSKLVIATTPKPFPWYKELVNSEDTQLITGKTVENTALPASYVEALKRRYGENSTILLQELEAQIVDDVPGALWNYSSLAEITCELPDCSPDTTIISLDPSTGVKDGDEFGILVMHRFGRRIWVSADYTGLHTPEQAANIIAGLECDEVIMEGSGQQLFFKNILLSINPTIRVQVVHPRLSKLTRAEAVKIGGLNGEFFLDSSANLTKLSEEMTSYNGKGISPNRLDALSQGYRYLQQEPASTNDAGFFAAIKHKNRGSKRWVQSLRHYE